MTEETEYSALSQDEKKLRLYLRQKNMLDTFMETNALTQAEYNKSLEGLTRKMGMESILAESINNDASAGTF